MALTLEDIYKNNTYQTRYYRSVRWLEDAKHYTTLENNPDRSCSEMIRYQAKTGKREVLVAPVSLFRKEKPIPCVSVTMLVCR
jgi:dipeptidyl-peptidase-4